MSRNEVGHYEDTIKLRSSFTSQNLLNEYASSILFPDKIADNNAPTIISSSNTDEIGDNLDNHNELCTYENIVPTHFSKDIKEIEQEKEINKLKDICFYSALGKYQHEEAIVKAIPFVVEQIVKNSKSAIAEIGETKRIEKSLSMHNILKLEEVASEIHSSIDRRITHLQFIEAYTDALIPFKK